MAEPNIPAAFKYARTKKDHTCEGCQKTIPKGSISLHVHGRCFSWWFNEYWCWACDLDRIESIPDSHCDLRNKLYKEKADLQVSGQFLPQEKKE